MLSRDIPFVGLCPLSQKRLLASTEAEVLPLTMLREGILKHEGPHLASKKRKKKKKKLHFAMVMLGANGKNIFLSPETARVKMRKQKKTVLQKEQLGYVSVWLPM